MWKSLVAPHACGGIAPRDLWPQFAIGKFDGVFPLTLAGRVVVTFHQEKLFPSAN